MARLEGKTILVTAAGQGIGRAIALAAASEGARVHATDIDEGLLQHLASQPMIETMRLDVTEPSGIARVRDAIGGVDGLCNVAGFVHHGTVLDATDEEMTLAFDVNVRSMQRAIKAFLPAMLAAGGGSIVNIASVASSISGVGNRFVYGTTKAAVIGLTKSVARDFAGQGIRCNAIAPGTIDSPSLDARLAAFDDPEAARKAFTLRQPIGRIGRPEEIAAITTYLLGDESEYATGAIFTVDGGMTM